VSHVTGAGVTGVADGGRTCVECKHKEIEHFPKCYHPGCGCRNFMNWKPSRKERKIMEQQGKAKETKALDEYQQFKDDLAKAVDRAIG